MAKIEISKMKKEVPAGTIDCGNDSINALIEKSYYPTILQHAYGYLICIEHKIIGAYMIKFVKIKLEDCPEEVSEYVSDLCEDCFSIHIKFIAIDTKYQKRGCGTHVLMNIVRQVRELCDKWPIRLITLDALKDKYEWYCSLGFVAFNEEDYNDENSTIKMYLDCLIDPEVVNTYCDLLVSF